MLLSPHKHTIGIQHIIRSEIRDEQQQPRTGTHASTGYFTISFTTALVFGLVHEHFKEH